MYIYIYIYIYIYTYFARSTIHIYIYIYIHIYPKINKQATHPPRDNSMFLPHKLCAVPAASSFWQGLLQLAKSVQVLLARAFSCLQNLCVLFSRVLGSAFLPKALDCALWARALDCALLARAISLRPCCQPSGPAASILWLHPSLP